MRSTLGCALAVAALPSLVAADERQFREQVAPVLEQHCVRCHRGPQPAGGLDLTRRTTALTGGENGPALVPRDPDASLLVIFVSGDDPEMPRAAEPLSREQVDVLRRWIAAGAAWPDGRPLEDRSTWWSLAPLDRPDVPTIPAVARPAGRLRTPVDAFVLAEHEARGLHPSPEADRRTLIRRLTFDLHGLPPAPEEIDEFLADDSPAAWPKLVDRLLGSPRYGERWARHWLDVVHYGDTHGYDKDKRRPNAWPYRDYVIRALNADKPYDEFVREQLADDTGPATGFIVAGPWDFVGHVELREGTTDKEITRSLDRDDMVMNAMSTFTSLTVHCARCHDHKFDPITQDDYYSLQAVFAGVERADRPYDPDPQVAARRAELAAEIARVAQRLAAMQAETERRAGPRLAEIRERLAALAGQKRAALPPEHGYHSAIERMPDVPKWVQVDLGRPVPIDRIVLVGCHDDFAGIGAGFGFPVRYKVEIAGTAEFGGSGEAATLVADHTTRDVPNPGVAPQTIDAGGATARSIRVTATKLAPRQNDYIFALAELQVLTPGGTNAAAGARVTALDSIEAPVRWRKTNLVDGIYPGSGDEPVRAEIARFEGERDALLAAAATPELRRERHGTEESLARLNAELAELPPPQAVFAATSRFTPQGAFTPPPGGRPRPIHVLHRGSVASPGERAAPGTVSCVRELPARFELSDPDDESSRRAALAEWIVDRRNPLTWRSIANRVWHYHFGRGIVETPNDFGRMGARPTHPELLDWLAAEFVDGQRDRHAPAAARAASLKRLHRLIVSSGVYRQTSASDPDRARLDAGNLSLWRMNRRRLEAEAVRDAVLSASGTLRQTMYGPGFDLFGFVDDHSPHYHYDEHDVDDPATLRRTIYRFIVRSAPDPFLETLDCPDPSLNADRRNTTITALQALALLNNRFMVRQAEHFAARVAALSDDPRDQIEAAYRLALGRPPRDDEAAALTVFARQHGLANVCRVLFNMNEFLFVD